MTRDSRRRSRPNHSRTRSFRRSSRSTWMKRAFSSRYCAPGRRPCAIARASVEAVWRKWPFHLRRSEDSRDPSAIHRRRWRSLLGGSDFPRRQSAFDHSTSVIPSSTSSITDPTSNPHLLQRFDVLGPLQLGSGQQPGLGCRMRSRHQEQADCCEAPADVLHPPATGAHHPRMKPVARATPRPRSACHHRHRCEHGAREGDRACRRPCRRRSRSRL